MLEEIVVVSVQIKHRSFVVSVAFVRYERANNLSLIVIGLFYCLILKIILLTLSMHSQRTECKRCRKQKRCKFHNCVFNQYFCMSISLTPSSQTATHPTAPFTLVCFIGCSVTASTISKYSSLNSFLMLNSDSTKLLI